MKVLYSSLIVDGGTINYTDNNNSSNNIDVSTTSS